MPFAVEKLIRTALSLFIFVVVWIYLYATVYSKIIYFFAMQRTDFLIHKHYPNGLGKGAGLGAGMEMFGYILLMFILFIVINLIVWFMGNSKTAANKFISRPMLLVTIFLFLGYTILNYPGQEYWSYYVSRDTYVAAIVYSFLLLIAGPQFYFIAWAIRKSIMISFKVLR